MAKEQAQSTDNFEKISRERFDGFFQYEEGNQITGRLVDESIKQKNDRFNDGAKRDKGYFIIEVTVPDVTAVKSDKDDDSRMAKAGEKIAVPYCEATKCMRGLCGQKPIMRVTYNKFHKSRDSKFHDMTIEKAR